MKKCLALFISVMVFFGASISSSINILADDTMANATVKNVKFNDYSFKLLAGIFEISDCNEIGAQGGIYEKDFKDLPKGYLGAKIGIYSGSSLIAQTDYLYTNEESSSVGVVINKKVDGYSSVRAKSTSKIYRGNEYSTYESNYTPYVNNPNVKSFNANKEIYGSSLYTSEAELDLIEAIGINGIKGYVRSEDLNGSEPKTPQEALAQQKINTGDTLIPVYDKEGIKIVDMFRIVQSTASSFDAEQ